MLSLFFFPTYMANIASYDSQHFSAKLLREATAVIRSHDGPKNLILPYVLDTVFGAD